MCMFVPLLSACGEYMGFKVGVAGLAATSHGVFSNPNVNLKEKSFAAADFLTMDLKQSPVRRQVLSTQNDYVLLMKPLVEVDNEQITSPFGHAVPEAMGLRFAELGYRTYLNEVAPEGNKNLYPKPPANIKPNLIVTGAYKVNPKTVDVKLRIFSADSGQIVTYFDYTMPLSREIRNLAKTQTRIYRISSDN